MAFICHGKWVFWQRTTTAMLSPVLAAVSADLMGELLTFTGLFAASTGLPPERMRCHRIVLKPDTGPVVVRPYRHAHVQTKELERQCKEMLRLDVIRPSSSAFTTPVLLFSCSLILLCSRIPVQELLHHNAKV